MRLVITFLLAAVLLGVAGPAPPPWLASFTWSGNGANDRWDNYDNWDANGQYPDGTGDNATVPYNAADVWSVDLVDVSIGDLTIEGSVSFGTVSSPDTLQIDGTLTIDADSDEVQVTIESGATIENTE